MSMGEEERRHIEAAQQHEENARLHEESALFWDRQGDADRARQERDLGWEQTRLSKRAFNDAAHARQRDGQPPQEPGNGTTDT